MTEFALAHPWLTTLVALAAVAGCVDVVRVVALAVGAIATRRAP